MVQQAQILRCIEAVALGQQAFLDQQALDELVARLVELDLTGLLIDVVMAFNLLHALFGEVAALEQGDQLVDRRVHARAVFGRPGDDQRRTGFIDQDRVDLVDDRKIQFPLELVFQPERHVVAQIVETKLVIGTVGNVASVRCLLVLGVLERHHDTHGQTKEFVQRAHPVGIAASQVIVDRHRMHTLAAQGVQVGWQGGHEGLALTGFHFGNMTLMQGHPANHLGIEMTHAHDPFTRLAHQGEGFGQNGIQAFALGNPFLVLGCLGLQLLIAQGVQLFFLGVDRVDDPAHAL